MKVLGISAYFHDAGAALVVDGQIVAAAQEERFSRIKHDAALPRRAAAFCLRQAGLEAADLDYIVFYEKPLQKFERIVVNALQHFPKSLAQFNQAMGTWLGRRLWLADEMASAFAVPHDRLLFCQHHLSHAASSFLCAPCDDAAIVTVDGVGEWATTTLYHGTTGNDGRPRIEPLKELRFPHSLGLLYSAITAFLGFAVNEGEYKVMGLAAYGRPTFLDAFQKMAHVDHDGALTLAPRYFAFAYDPQRSYTAAVEELLGAPFSPSTSWDDLNDDERTRYANIAASLQAFTETYMLRLAVHARELTASKNLCLAGGVALNGVANHRLAENAGFERLYVQPAAGDAGGALGAALYTACVVGDDPRPTLNTTALGEGFAPSDVARFLSDCGAPHTRHAQPIMLFDAIARRLALGELGAVVRGRAEWGPRALGQRSILADPRSAETRERLNRAVKYREPFRPFAPAVLAEDLDEWFDGGSGADQALLPFMCTVLPALPSARAQLPAVVHADGTARVQTVRADSDTDFHALLTAFKRHTGVGVLLNTSFNLAGEPICNSPADAYSTFLRSNLDFLVLEDCVVDRDRRVA